MSTQAPHVCLLGTVLAQPMGGVRRHNAELIARVGPALARAGGSLTVLAGRDGPAFELPSTVRLVRTDVPSAPVWTRAWREPRALARLVDAAASELPQFDLVHTAHLPTPSPRCLRGLPLVTLLHDLRQLDPARVGRPRAALGRRLYGRAVAHSTRIVLVSEQVRSELERRYPAARGRTAVIHNAADHLERPATAPAPPRGLEPGYLLHVGHLEPRKNLRLLLATLAADARLPPLVLAGAGPERRALERGARELGVADRVRFLGPVEERELVPLYLSAACVVLPSYLEGFGLAAEEARQLGLRLAIANRGALPEVAGDAAPRFEPDDPRGTARAIHTALSNPPPTPSGRVWEASARRLLALWRRAVNER